MLLSLQRVKKAFPGVQALAGVDYELRKGEIHALLGENGAGKSTLIKILAGVYQLDEGKQFLNGAPYHPHSPVDAIGKGISTVHQESHLLKNLSIAENICLGREPRNRWGLDWKSMANEAQAALDRIGLKLDVNRNLGGHSIAIQQLVAIARAISNSAEVLILDEPTSSLDKAEVDQLFQVMQSLKSEGMGIIFISHFLDQVYEIADRMTVLRNGELVGTWKTTELSQKDLVSKLIGREAEDMSRVGQTLPNTSLIMSASNLSHRGQVSEIEFKLHQGEVLGLAGLLGSGRTETLNLLFGVTAPTTGSILIQQRRHRLNPRKAIRSGIAYCTEDRKAEGIFPGLSLRENLILASQASRGWFRPFTASAQKKLASDLIERLSIRPARLETSIENLSGGNQQKALLARWMPLHPTIWLLDEPTKGIDIGAKFEIMNLVTQLSSAGTGFIFVSSELSEVTRVSHKVLVLKDRKMIGELEGAAISEENVIERIAGGKP